MGKSGSVQDLRQYKANNMRTESMTIKTYFVLCVIAISLCNAELSEYFHGTADNAGYLSLERIFTSEEFKVEAFGPARWLEDGFGYTILENSQILKEGDSPTTCDAPEDERPKDIVRYDPETGERTIVVPSTRLIPKGRITAVEDRRLFLVEGRQETAGFYKHQACVAQEYTWRLLGARFNKLESTKNSAGMLSHPR